MVYDETTSKRTGQILELAIQNQINHQQRLNAIAEKHVNTLLEKGNTEEAMKTMRFFNNEANRNIKNLLDYRLKGQLEPLEDNSQSLDETLCQPSAIEKILDRKKSPKEKKKAAEEPEKRSKKNPSLIKELNTAQNIWNKLI